MVPRWQCFVRDSWTVERLFWSSVHSSVRSIFAGNWAYRRGNRTECEPGYRRDGPAWLWNRYISQPPLLCGSSADCEFLAGTTFVLYPGISELLPNKWRNYGLAWTELNLLPFTTFGPLLARALLERATWRWVYYLGVITGVISLAGTAIFYVPPSKPIRDRTRLELLRELDYLGIFLYTAGLTLFLLGLGWGGINYSWRSAAVITPLILGAVMFGLTFVWDFSGIPKRPLFPLRLLKMFRDYTSLLVIIFVTGLVYFSMTDLIPIQLSDMYASNPIRAGLYNIPGGFGGAAGGVIMGSLISKLKRVHWQLVVGIAMQTLFAGLFAILTPDTLGAALAFQLLANLPFAWITLNCYVVAGLNVPQRDLGLALGLVGTFRFLGGAVGTTVSFVDSAFVDSEINHWIRRFSRQS